MEAYEREKRRPAAAHLGNTAGSNANRTPEGSLPFLGRLIERSVGLGYPRK